MLEQYWGRALAICLRQTLMTPRRLARCILRSHDAFAQAFTGDEVALAAVIQQVIHEHYWPLHSDLLPAFLTRCCHCLQQADPPPRRRSLHKLMLQATLCAWDSVTDGQIPIDVIPLPPDEGWLARVRAQGNSWWNRMRRLRRWRVSRAESDANHDSG